MTGLWKMLLGTLGKVLEIFVTKSVGTLPACVTLSKATVAFFCMAPALDSAMLQEVELSWSTCGVWLHQAELTLTIGERSDIFMTKQVVQHVTAIGWCVA